MEVKSPKKRGRPLKNPEFFEKSPRRRGRPPKNSPCKVERIDPFDKNLESPRKPRGRPPSNSLNKLSNRLPLHERQNYLKFDDDESDEKFGSSIQRSRSLSFSRVKNTARSEDEISGVGDRINFEESESDSDSDLDVTDLGDEFGKSVRITELKSSSKNVNNFLTWELEQNEKLAVFLNAVHEKLFDLDHVETVLTQCLSKLMKDDEGIVTTLYGKRSSGKRTLINRLFKDRNDIEYLEMDGQFSSVSGMKSQLSTMKSILESKEKPLVFVLHNFDALHPATVANKFLYSLTNHLRTHAFFLLLVTEKQGAVESLEKRIVSRIGQSSIKCMDKRLTSEMCWDLVCKLVAIGLAACNDKQAEKVFTLPMSPPEHFDRLCNRLPNYAELKLFVKKLADEVFDAIEDNKPVQIDDFCKRLLVPVDNMMFRMQCLTDRMFGLLVAAAITTLHITKWIPIRKVFEKYKSFVNTYQIKAPFLLIEEKDFYEDVEYMINLRFWTVKRQCEKIVAIAWLEDPLIVANKRHNSIFNTHIIQWVGNELKDDRQLY